jgi:hypothetical protein
MSQWTHVAGVIRFDDMRRALVRDEYRHLAAQQFPLGLPTPYPSGSEGPLRVRLEDAGPDAPYSYFVTATVFGDLRDFGSEDLPQLEKWWRTATREIPPGVAIRQAVLHVAVEGEKPVIWHVYDEANA